MVINSTALKNAGYLLVLLPQILYVIGILAGFPWLAVLFFFGVVPFLRKYVGNDTSLPNLKASPLLCLYLRSIPRLYFVTWAIVLPWTIWVLATQEFALVDYLGIGLSLWIIGSLNTAIAHEMIHSNSRIDRFLGSILDASVGYCHFPEEHLSHHERTGHHHGGDAAKPGTSIYRYAFSRYIASFSAAWEFEASRLKRLGLSWWFSRPVRRAALPISIAGAFLFYVGWTGLLFYILQILGAAFSVQAITYLQHWGLSQRETPDLADFGFAWEDGCWMQACVTLNHAYHGQHHLNLRLPYYRLSMAKDALTLPASYPVMFVVALVPPLFTRIMAKRLQRWLNDVDSREDLVYQSECVSAARIARMVKRM